MALNRPKSDACVAQQDLVMSTRPTLLRMDLEAYEHCRPCASPFGMRAGRTVSLVRDHLDVSNMLRGTGGPLTSCVEHQPRPWTDPKVLPGIGKDYLWCGRVHPDVDLTTAPVLRDCDPFYRFPARPGDRPPFPGPSCT